MDRDVRQYQSLFGLYILPLQKMGGHIAKWVGAASAPGARRANRRDPAVNMHSTIREAAAERLEIVTSTERLGAVAEAWLRCGGRPMA